MTWENPYTMGGVGKILPCIPLTLATWDSCPHAVPEPDWPDGHVPTADGCSCGWVKAPFGGSWVSAHLVEVLGERIRDWGDAATRRLLRGHQEAIRLGKLER